MKKFNNSLEQFDLQISLDTDVPDPEIMGFFIPLEQIQNMIVSALKGPGSTNTPPSAPPPSPSDIKRSVPKADIDSLNKLKSMGDHKDLDKDLSFIQIKSEDVAVGFRSLF